MKLFFFKSSRKSDKLSQISVMTSSARRAYALAIVMFIKSGYKGKPVLI